MILEKVAMFFVIMFAIIGTGVVSLVIHEYTHYNDFKDFNFTDERLCLIVIPTENNNLNLSKILTTPIAYYHYTFYEEDMTPEELAKYKRKSERTEINAYTIGSLIFLFYMLCYFIITFSRYRDKKKLLIYKYKLQDREDYINELENYIEKNDRKI